MSPSPTRLVQEEVHKNQPLPSLVQGAGGHFYHLLVLSEQQRGGFRVKLDSKIHPLTMSD